MQIFCVFRPFPLHPFVHTCKCTCTCTLHSVCRRIRMKKEEEKGRKTLYIRCKAAHDKPTYEYVVHLCLNCFSFQRNSCCCLLNVYPKKCMRVVDTYKKYICMRDASKEETNEKLLFTIPVRCGSLKENENVNTYSSPSHI